MSEPQIPGFEVLERIGSGGMSTVWKAKQVSLDRLVAVKVLAARMASDPSDIKQFQFEAQAAARLKHPGIVQVYDASIANGLYYIVMEYVAGYTVGDWTRRKRRLPETDVLLVCECVADALQYAWQQAGIVHCDVKPDNVIIDDDGTVKVADLGLARTIHAVGPEGVVEEVMGTPNYISPEQSSGTAELDCRTDIYALGAMMYHLATGHMMFEGEDPAKVMDLQITDTVEDPAELCDELSPGICWLIEKMTVKDAALRVDTWDEVLRDIDRVKRGLFPARPLPEAGDSTVRRSEAREEPPPPGTGRMQVSRTLLGHARTAQGESGAGTSPRLLIWSVVLAIVACGTALYYLVEGQGLAIEPAPAPDVTSTTSGADTAALRAQRLFLEAARWSQERPEAYEEAIQRFRRVQTLTAGTRYAARAEAEAARVRRARDAAAEDVLRRLDEEALRAVAGNRHRQALRIYTGYTGPLADLTATAREARAADLRKRIAEVWRRAADTSEHAGDEEHASSTERDPAVLFAEGLDAVADDLIAGRGAAAHERLLAMSRDARFEAQRSELVRVAGVVGDYLGMEERILGSFRTQKGQRLVVELEDGEETILVKDVIDGTVVADARLRTGSGSAVHEIRFGVDDLTLRERLQRMGPDTWPDVALGKGLLAVEAQSLAYARKSFERVGGPLAERLVTRCAEATTSAETGHGGAGGGAAEEALRLILHALGVAVEAYDAEAWIGAVEAADLAPAQQHLARELARDYRATYAGTPFAHDVEPVLRALESQGTP